jgi:hypothetical protein
MKELDEKRLEEEFPNYKNKQLVVEDEDEESKPKCEEGHEMERFDGSHPTYRAGYALCDECSSEARKGWHCKICKADYCDQCAKSKK